MNNGSVQKLAEALSEVIHHEHEHEHPHPELIIHIDGKFKAVMGEIHGLKQDMTVEIDGLKQDMTIVKNHILNGGSDPTPAG